MVFSIRVMRVGWAIAATLCVGVGGCTSSEVFQCQTDGQCVNGDAAGACQPNGFCSFVDRNCASGFRYASSAPPGLAGACVEVEPDASSSTGCMTASCADSTAETGANPPASTSAPGTTQAATATATTGIDDASSTTSTSEDASETSTGPAIECPQFVEEFDDGIVETPPWIWQSAMPSIMSESEGRLRYAIDTGFSGFASIVYPDVDLSGDGYVVAHLVQPTEDGFGQFLLRVLDADGPASATLVLTGDTELSVRLNGIAVEFLNLPPFEELWLEIFVLGGEVNFAYSTDGDAFLPVHAAAIPFDFVASEVQLMAGAYAVTTAQPHFIELEDFEFCEAPFRRDG